MKNTLKIALLFLIAFSCNSEEREHLIIQEFFKTFNHQNSGKAIDGLFSTNKWIDNNDPQILKLKKDIDETINAIGNYYGYEQVSSVIMGDNLIQYEYLLRFDAQPLRFTITLFKPDNEWQVQNFHYDYKFIDELKEKN